MGAFPYARDLKEEDYCGTSHAGRNQGKNRAEILGKGDGTFRSGASGNRVSGLSGKTGVGIRRKTLCRVTEALDTCGMRYSGSDDAESS